MTNSFSLDLQYEFAYFITSKNPFAMARSKIKMSVLKEMHLNRRLYLFSLVQSSPFQINYGKLKRVRFIICKIYQRFHKWNI